mgnify:CR=1 FL=1
MTVDLTGKLFVVGQATMWMVYTDECMSLELPPGTVFMVLCHYTSSIGIKCVRVLLSTAGELSAALVTVDDVIARSKELA